MRRFSAAAVALLTGLTAAIALGALNHAAHPGAAVSRLLWAGVGLIAAGAAIRLAGRGKEPVCS